MAKTIRNYMSNTLLSGTSGNDKIYNGGRWDYTWHNGGEYVTINGGKGNDYIRNYGDSVTIDAGVGNDEIYNEGSEVTLDAGAGNDYIHSSGSNTTISTGDGNDIIYNDADFVKIDLGTGDDSIYNAWAQSVTILGGEGNDTIQNFGGSNSVIDFGAGDDFIQNYADSVSIDAGKGNDSIENSGRNNVTINGGKGNDSIFNDYGYYSKIDGGAGNDFIYNDYGHHSTIDAGKGSDTISLSPETENNLIQYAVGDGNDTVIGFNSTSTLQISGGTGTYSTQTSGNDVLVKVGKGSIRLKNVYATADTIHINKKSISLGRKAITLTADNNDIDITRDSVSVVGSAKADTIYNSGNSVTINAGKGNDSIENYVAFYSSINGGAGNDSIHIYGRYVTINGGKGNDSISLGRPTNNYVIKYNSGDDNDTIVGFDSTSTLQIGGGKGTYSTQISGNDVLVKVGKGSIRLKNVYATADTIHINKKSINLERKAITLTADNNDIEIRKDSVSVVGSSGNDSILNWSSNVTINAGKGGDDIDNYNGASVSINGGIGNDTISNSGSNVTINGGKGNDWIFNNGGDSVTIDGAAGNDSISNYASNVTIKSGSDNDSIFNNSGSNATIEGGTGNDFIINRGFNTTFKYNSGDGNDTIQGFNATSTLKIASSYSTKKKGDDIIVTVGKGKITLQGAATLSALNIIDSTLSIVTNSTKSPVTVGSTIKTIDAKTRTTAVKITGNKLNNLITGGSGKDTIYGGKGNDTLVGGSGNDKLYGQAGNDIIKGGKGKDSLWGGAGNDSLWGGDGNDTFIYNVGEGKDTILDYKSGDMLKIVDGTFSNSKYSKGMLTLTIGDGSVIFDNVTTSTTFNINGKSYKISGSKLK